MLGFQRLPPSGPVLCQRQFWTVNFVKPSLSFSLINMWELEGAAPVDLTLVVIPKVPGRPQEDELTENEFA